MLSGLSIATQGLLEEPLLKAAQGLLPVTEQQSPVYGGLLGGRRSDRRRFEEWLLDPAYLVIEGRLALNAEAELYARFDASPGLAACYLSGDAHVKLSCAGVIETSWKAVIDEEDDEFMLWLD